MIWWAVGVVLGLLAIPGVLHLFRRKRPRDQLDFNIIDEAIHHLDVPDEPWTVHLEARLGGAVDPARLERAILLAATKHPMARAYQRKWRPWHTVYRWQIEAKLEHAPLEVVACATDEDVTATRARFQSTRCPIDAAPPFRMLLAKREGGDYVMINFNHAAADGVGTLRFLRSVGLAYGEAPDPTPESALAWRDLTRTSAPTAAEGWQRQLFMNQMLREAVSSAPTRLAIQDGTPAPGFGFSLRRLPSALTEGLAKAKIAGGTVNDLLLAVLHRVIAKWNQEHGEPDGRISTMMPVNVRPKETWTEAVSNITYFVSVSTRPSDRDSVESSVGAIREQATAVKEKGTAGVLREILFGSPLLLLEVKRRMPALIGLAERFIDTAVLSNLGRLNDRLVFGDLGEATELWFSPPCRMPLGLGIGAAGYCGETFLVFRYRHAQLSADAAERFADAYVRALEASLETPKVT